MTTIGILSFGVNGATGPANPVTRRVEPGHDVKGDGEVAIILNNVCSTFRLGCEVCVTDIAEKGNNVEYNRNKTPHKVIMRLIKPKCMGTIWASGKVCITGAITETDARTGARRCARALQKMGFGVKFLDYKVVNIIATCKMPFGIKITDLATANPTSASYEPGRHSGVVYKMEDVRATLMIYSSGHITVFAPDVEKALTAVKQIYSLVAIFKEEGEWWKYSNRPTKIPRLDDDADIDEENAHEKSAGDKIQEDIEAFVFRNEGGEDDVEIRLDVEDHEEEFFDSSACESCLDGDNHDDQFYDCI